MLSTNLTRRTCLAALSSAWALRGFQDAITPEDVVTGLDTPWAIGFLPDGRMLFTERSGRVSMVENGARRTIARIGVREHGEGGLLGLAVDPDFAQNRAVFLYYTIGGSNRISRFELKNGSLEGDTPVLTGIPAARFHNGGRIRFGPDHLLYVCTGDARQPRLAQDRNSLAGKILRIQRDGSAADGNPFGNRIWAYGLRNSQGIDWRPGAGQLYATDHGPNRHDAVYRIEAGGDYGWPQTCSEQGNSGPALRCYTEFTLAPGGLAFHGDDAYIGGLRGTQLRRLRMREDQIVSEQALLSGHGRIREVLLHDGWIYATTSNRDGRGRARSGDDRIFRFRPAGRP